MSDCSSWRREFRCSSKAQQYGWRPAQPVAERDRTLAHYDRIPQPVLVVTVGVVRGEVQSAALLAEDSAANQSEGGSLLIFSYPTRYLLSDQLPNTSPTSAAVTYAAVGTCLWMKPSTTRNTIAGKHPASAHPVGMSPAAVDPPETAGPGSPQLGQVDA